MVVTPEEWLANFEAKIAEVQQKTAAFKQNLEASGATESSADGSLRVTVAPNGALTDLTIDESAMRRSGGELAGQIMQLARQAQRAAAVHVAEAFAPLSGEDSEALHMVVGYIPPEEDEPEPESPSRPNRPRSTSNDDDEDFGDDQIFGRKDEW